ncbi:MAG: NAD(P)/FAD-dependent oxidoreductase [archaeon]
MSRVAVVGAGPVGSFAAKLLAARGHDVTVVEEHKKIGIPVQCTGLATPALGELTPIKKSFVINRIRHIRLRSPNRELRLKKDEIVIDRELFDQSMSNDSVDSGARLRTGCRFIGRTANGLTVRNASGEREEVRADYTIGADGPVSAVAKSAGMLNGREFLSGIQARVKTESDPQEYTAWLGRVCPGFFAWAVPESDEVARVGLAARSGAKELFRGFMKRSGYTKVLDMQAGLIPVYSASQSTQRGNVLLVGDAAGQVKASTGGGIVPGLAAAQCLAENLGSGYGRAWRQKIGRTLRVHLLIRKTLDRFTDRDYDRLLELAGQKRIRVALERGNREFPMGMLARIALKEPRFLGFIKKGIFI